MHLDQDQGWNVCLKWHTSWRNLTSSNRFRADTALKRCVSPTVHYQSPVFTGNATLKGETSIMLKTMFFLLYPLALMALTANSRALCCPFVESEELSSPIPSLLSLILVAWGYKRKWPLVLGSASAQTEHERRSHYHADVNTVDLAQPLTRERSSGSGGCKVILVYVTVLVWQ